SYISGSVSVEDHDIMIVDLEYLTADILPDLAEISDHTQLEKRGTKTEREQVRILFAEDSTFIRKVTVKKLAKTGYKQIEEATDGQEAYDRIAELKKAAEDEGKSLTEYYDVILTDIEMPKMDGLTLCKRVKTDLHIDEVPVVLYSSLMSREMELKAQTVNADACLTKPKVEEIVDCLDDIILHRK
ncbi:response regulator, partial [bacterium]|nr:response regulator [bacterium]